MDLLSLAGELVRCYVHPQWEFDELAVEYRIIWRPVWSRQPLVMPLRSWDNRRSTTAVRNASKVAATTEGG